MYLNGRGPRGGRTAPAGAGGRGRGYRPDDSGLGIGSRKGRPSGHSLRQVPRPPQRTGALPRS